MVVGFLNTLYGFVNIMKQYQKKKKNWFRRF